MYHSFFANCDHLICSLSTALCDQLTAPQFGSVSLSGVSVGSVATYTCDTGFTLVGDITRDCVQLSPATADWNRDEPTCQREYQSIAELPTFEHYFSI